VLTSSPLRIISSQRGALVWRLAFCALIATLGGCVGKTNVTYSRTNGAPSPAEGGVPMVDSGAPDADGRPADGPGSTGAPTCVDHLKDGVETDVDCGGSGSCDRCGNGKACVTGTDCMAGACSAGLCQTAGCANASKDGSETDVDCGGPACGPCGEGKSCRVAADCSSGTCTGGVCEVPSCTDHMMNGGETDVDCGGGACPACPPQGGCAIARDCTSGVCAGGSCAVASCADTVKNQGETGVDCGGPCPPCPSGQPCLVPADCHDGVCSAGLCSAGACTDMVMNGTETDVDCGGACPGKCATGKACATATDCLGGVCTAGLCQSATCADLTLNGTETDVDCGGAGCARCQDGKACLLASDCVSGVCTAGVCATPSCADAVKNSSETDVDCGGPCPGCGAAQKCKVGGDCTSLVCTAGACAARTCTDKVENGSETDVDCGGADSLCPACAPSKTCLVGADCQSGNCMGGLCQAPTCTDGIKNGSETDVDCGSTSCPACAAGKACAVAKDCESQVCPAAAKLCAAPSCTDAVSNGTETDVDCGGTCAAAPTGRKCADGKKCGGGGDCASGVCGATGTCTPASCSDTVVNGTETDVDCGGSCAGAPTNKKCADGKACGTSGANCASGVCMAGQCQPASCADLVKNGSETDVDCGGACPSCANGKMCGTGTAAGGNCASGVCTSGLCATPSCTDTVKNGTETAVDCGGSCAASPTNKKCPDGQACAAAGDCVNAVCLNGICAAANCADGVRNSSETDVDCGGSCPGCADGKMCGTGTAAGANCASGVCTSGACAAPTCSDGVKNGSETAVDCGGSCAASPTSKKCGDGKGCAVAADCLNGICGANGTCTPASCSDALKNGNESDVDCGGSCAAAPTSQPCAAGQMCGTSGANCASGVCAAGLCAAPTCSDGVKNGDETGLDCGGAGACARCGTGLGCGTGSDCASGVCTAGLCAAPSCTDKVQNGVETGVDCGGANSCPRCAAGVGCSASTDCSSPLYCPAATPVCTAPTCSDLVKNGSETDVDCGGSCAPLQTCANGKMCIANADCASSNCASMLCSALGCQTCWKVQYKNSDATNKQWSDQVVSIVSIGTTSSPLSQFKIRYWFDADGEVPTGATCYSAPSSVGGCTKVTETLVAVSPPRPKATYYLEIGFTSTSSLAAGAQTLDIQTAFHYASWNNVDRTNDYSYDGTKTSLTDWANVTLYNNGNKVWGNEPPP